jgi:hypothetical protein
MLIYYGLFNNEKNPRPNAGSGTMIVYRPQGGDLLLLALFIIKFRMLSCTKKAPRFLGGLLFYIVFLFTLYT